MNNAEISRAVRAAIRPIREQRDMWRQATVGVLALSIVGNIGLYSTVWYRESKHQAETRQLQAELQHAESVRDQAVRELGALANQTAREDQARREQAEYYEALGDYQYIGECTITAYCPCVECCGEYADGLTAIGFPALPGVVAVDPEIIPLGSTVIIDGNKFLAADTGVTGNHIDICFSYHFQAEEYGVRTAEVWVSENGNCTSRAPTEQVELDERVKS